MARKWRPLCHGMQWAEWKDACEICPFWATCKDGTEKFKAKKDAWRRRDLREFGG